MQGFPVPAEEKMRLKELQTLRFNEREMRTTLDDLCLVVARLLDAPMANLSLVGRDEQIFAGRSGIDWGGTGRAVAFCAHTIMSSEPLIIEDAANDPRFSQNQFVAGSPYIRSYIGVPLETTPGLRIGALCAIDLKPRTFTETDVRTIKKLARFAESILKSYRASLNFNDQMERAIELQGRMLPGKAQLDAIQASCPVDLASFYKARDGVGGDIWGGETLGPQRLLLYAADFTGHGIAAALNTARFHSFAHLVCSSANSPATLLRQMNDWLHEVLPAGQFATMSCAVLDFQAQTLEYSSAGAPPQLYRRSCADPFEVLQQSSLPLGVMRGATFEGKTLPFLPGGAVVLFTDGLIETPRPPAPIFTPDSLKQLLNAFPGGGAAEISDKITSALFFDPSIPIEDDLTLIVARRTRETIPSVMDLEI